MQSATCRMSYCGHLSIPFISRFKAENGRGDFSIETFSSPPSKNVKHCSSKRLRSSTRSSSELKPRAAPSPQGSTNRASVSGATRTDGSVKRDRLLSSLADMNYRLRRSIEAEAEAMHEQVTSLYSGKSEKELAREGFLLLRMTVKQSGRLYGDFLLRIAKADGDPLPLHRFRQGGTVCIKDDEERVGVDAVVSDVSTDAIHVTLPRSSADDIFDLPRSTLFKVEVSSQDTTALRQLAALDELMNIQSRRSAGAQAVRAILLESPVASRLASQTPRWIKSRARKAKFAGMLERYEGLNPSQRGAIGAALTRTWTLWQGPPGTGKTRTLLAFLDILCRFSSSMERNDMGQILAVADTNAAADNLLNGMLAVGVDAVRVGQAAKVRPELRHACLEARAEASSLGVQAASLRDQATSLLQRSEQLYLSGSISERDRKELLNESKRLWAAAETRLKSSAQTILDKAKVVVGTCAAAGDVRMKDRTFSVVVIDEATQSTEPSTLIPLMKDTECIVMAGDHKQLPPLVLSKEALENKLDVPLFRRLQDNGMPTLLLDTQYRMHPKIASFPSRHFYGGHIKCGIKESEREPVSVFSWPDSSQPIAFVKCEALEKRSSSKLNDVFPMRCTENGSYYNETQASLSIHIVKRLLQDPTLPSIALLTPYNAQLRLLYRYLKSELELATACNLERLVISTIDGFQGREADVVVLTTVRSNHRGSLGFLRDVRRMNVALTRAQRGLIVIGSACTLCNDPHWKAWLTAHRNCMTTI